MASLKAELGSVKLPALNRERLIEFGRKRAKQGAGPATLAIDLSFIRTIITRAAAVHGIEVSAEEARLARVALSYLNLVGKSNERDRRPTQDELNELIEYFETNPRQFIPMGRIVRYAVATTLRQEEICKPEWPLVDMKKRLVVIQDRKDPRNKEGNDQKVPLLNLTGYDAWEVVLQQRIVTRGYGRIFPHNHRSISAAFTRACVELKIVDLHFHDLRHEGTSRLFEAGLPIEKVALVAPEAVGPHMLDRSAPNLHVTPVARPNLPYRASAPGFRYLSPLAVMAQSCPRYLAGERDAPA